MSALVAAWAVVVCLISITLFCIAAATFWWQIHAWMTPDAYDQTGYPDARDHFARHSFSLIVPCRNEPERVVRATLERLLAQEHPDFEIIVSVGHDDLPTLEIARRLAAENPGKVSVSVNTDPVKNKPRQLNTALAACTKDVVGIVDAESMTSPGLLQHVDMLFHRESADVVQGSVHLVNYRATWFSLRNCLEYRVWFRSRLHAHAAAGFIPLGGNTVFVTRAVLQDVQVNGWDGNCLAEDCDLGVRLSTQGRKIVVAYDAELTTQEEAPELLSVLVRQRTRWALGYMQVLAKGDWRRLPTFQLRASAFWTLVQQHAMAFAGLALPIAVLTALLVDLPLPLVFVSFLPLVPTVITVVFDVLILHEFGKHMRFPIRFLDYLRLVVSTPFYQLLLALASCRAAWKYVSGDFRWEKTGHTGAHLTPVPGGAS